MKKYLTVYWLLTRFAMESSIATGWAMAIFIFGKILRLLIFSIFAYFLFTGTQGVAGYSKMQSLLFVLYFFLISAIVQTLFREAYRFRPRLVSGEFDFDLIKPVHPILRSLLGGFDLHDLITLPIIGGIFFYLLIQSALTLPMWILLASLSLNGILILFAVHLLVAGWMVITPEVDHALMIYRDVEMMGRFPVDIYNNPLRTVLTFVLPIGIVFTFPIKAMLGLISPIWIAASFLIGIIGVIAAFKFWNFAVKKYSSASS